MRARCTAKNSVTKRICEDSACRSMCFEDDGEDGQTPTGVSGRNRAAASSSTDTTCGATQSSAAQHPSWIISPYRTNLTAERERKRQRERQRQRLTAHAHPLVAQPDTGRSNRPPHALVAAPAPSAAAAHGAVPHPALLLGRLQYLRDDASARAIWTARVAHLEGAEQALVDAHHRARIVELAAVVGRAEERDERALRKELETILDDLRGRQSRNRARMRAERQSEEPP